MIPIQRNCHMCYVDLQTAAASNEDLSTTSQFLIEKGASDTNYNIESCNFTLSF